jgi:hypothetical protein
MKLLTYDISIDAAKNQGEVELSMLRISILAEAKITIIQNPYQYIDTLGNDSKQNSVLEN